MGSSRPPLRTQDFFPAPALSLSLAGAFGGNGPAAAGRDEVKDGDEGDGGIRSGLRRPGEAAEGSSENAETGSLSGGARPGEEAGGGDNKRKRTYQRHTTEQIRAMEALFKESPHPDEKQRQQLSQQLGLSARQVKFWFQNRRTQIKAIEGRQENSLLKSELEKVQEENRAMRELINKPSSCPNCGFSTVAGAEDKQLRLENARLKAEIEELRRAQGNAAAAAGAVASSTSPPSSARAIQTSNRSSSDDYIDAGLLGHDKTRILELAGRALDELTTMCSSGEPLWVRSVETGLDVLNYDEYVRLFRHDDDGDSGDRRAAWSVDASRETGVVYIDPAQLVHAFMDVNQWKEMFPSMISKAVTRGVIRAGENGHRDGIVQSMLAEIQTLTPLVPTREFHFLRHCKKLAADRWAIVDVSFDHFEPDAQPSSTLSMCLKKPSGCIVEEQTNGRCKVTWVEHTTCRQRQGAVPSMSRSRTATASGPAFSARRWVAALQLQCERMVFSVATNIPTRDSNGFATPAGRRSVLKLAHRMASSLCRVIGGSVDLAWSKASNHGGGQGIRVTSRKSTGDPGEPQGLIACAVASAWLPVNPAALFDFLRDESRRHEWDAMLPAGQFIQSYSYASVANGKDRGNCVTAYARKSSAGEQNGQWILQDSSTNACESILAYAAIDAAVLRPLIDGHDPSGVPVLPWGLAVTPDGMEADPAVITARKERDGAVADAEAARSLLTVAFQALATSSSATDGALPADAVETVTGLALRTLGSIKRALRCEDC